jgi:serine/threonine protein kinase
MIDKSWKTLKKWSIPSIVNASNNSVPEAKHLSAEVKDLIKKILVPNKQRITIEEILKHPWMTKQLSHEPLKIDFKKLREFSSFSKVDIE